MSWICPVCQENILDDKECHINCGGYYLNKQPEFTNEEQYLFDAIISARKIQEFLWGEYNSQWDLEEWKRMFKKRIVKIDDIDPDNPHAKIELKKRILQNAALCIALLNMVDNDKINEDCNIPSNLPQYEKR